jgi:hypothetical protein
MPFTLPSSTLTQSTTLLPIFPFEFSRAGEDRRTRAAEVALCTKATCEEEEDEGEEEKRDTRVILERHS